MFWKAFATGLIVAELLIIFVFIILLRKINRGYSQGYCGNLRHISLEFKELYSHPSAEETLGTGKSVSKRLFG